MIRIRAILVIAAIAASGVVSSASAQSFTNGMGTGNVLAARYDERGSLGAGLASQNATVTATRSGRTAYAAAPANRGPAATVSGSAGYSELLMAH
jgi:hypothetical protein